ncbi:hypothetical protein PPYR_05105 [Photinus pyralis]|uniref:Ubiquitin-like domain-containing protein n=1 Tax=Photinus pyralis TaxID=7054 RepID=A0A1Y1KLD0_PHOPY|nr:transmembrane and ubiquitin-like domain-containing protein 2 [Photinus pyralis]XP_031334839.1 transmembrane and ubiquitin-like domain-containing protein 2 [Photinus pyralis]KAB0802919.1 hypothetical protein PPYR_05105 [Photinus pyralis]
MFCMWFIKMLITDDFSNLFVQLLVAILIVAIVCFAWWSTNIREQPHYRTVFLLERRLRRRIHQSRLTTHIQSSSIVEGDQRMEEPTTPVANNQSAETNSSNLEGNKPPVATTSSTSNLGVSSTQTSGSSQNTEEEELADIVRIMDADTNIVRSRRLAYYENLDASQNRQQHSGEVARDPPSENTVDRDVNNSVETINDSIMEHNYAERDPISVNNDNEEKPSNSKFETEQCAAATNENSDSNIRIKLKYLNDELKLVNGRLEEQLGDFKRRHFHLEFSTNKLVRLIFNGQVLQPDTETLQSCGLFDNCVVHCLIHQQRNTHTEGNNNEDSFTSTRNSTNGLPRRNSNQGRDWDLGNILFVLLSFIIGSAWYFRYEYAHLYNVTATVALVAITGIFTVFLIGMYFPDPVPQPAPPQAGQEST